ncbi:MAG: hypothetical protein AAF572_01210 [Cyanobacteria bacterium P01_B01_bin.77]
MSRLSRRPSRVKPPLRGRAATKHYHGEFAPVASVRRPLKAHGSGLLPPRQEIKPPISVPDPRMPCPPPKPGLYANLVEFYKSWVKLLRSLNQPWQWLLAIAIILSSLLLLSQLK